MKSQHLKWASKRIEVGCPGDCRWQLKSYLNNKPDPIRVVRALLTYTSLVCDYFYLIETFSVFQTLSLFKQSFRIQATMVSSLSNMLLLRMSAAARLTAFDLRKKPHSGDSLVEMHKFAVLASVAAIAAIGGPPLVDPQSLPTASQFNEGITTSGQLDHDNVRTMFVKFCHHCLFYYSFCWNWVTKGLPHWFWRAQDKQILLACPLRRKLSSTWTWFLWKLWPVIWTILTKNKIDNFVGVVQDPLKLQLLKNIDHIQSDPRSGAAEVHNLNCIYASPAVISGRVHLREYVLMFSRRASMRLVVWDWTGTGADATWQKTIGIGSGKAQWSQVQKAIDTFDALKSKVSELSQLNDPPSPEDLEHYLDMLNKMSTNSKICTDY